MPGRRRKLQLARQHGLRHTGHADDVAAVTLHPRDLRDRLQARALGTAVYAMAAEGKALRGEGGDQALAQRLVVGIAEVDMRHLFELTFEKRMRSTIGVIDDLVRYAEVPRAHRSVDAAHRVDRHDALSPASFSAQRFAR